MKTNLQTKEIQSGAAQTGILWVVIPYTSPELTKAALCHAGVCTDLEVHVSLLDVQIVPFHRSLNDPPIDTKFSAQRLRDLVCGARVSGRADVVYARDWFDGFRRVLHPASLVIVCSKRRWWRTREEKLARILTKAGHHGVLLHA
jgi:hypothetical protein